MIAAQHSPAPWRTDGTAETDTLDIVSPLGRVAMLDCSHDLCIEDARLIAAAPDLLAALIDVLDADGDLDAMDFTRYRAAIAKATGGDA